MTVRSFVVFGLAAAALAVCTLDVTSQTEWDKYAGNPVLSPGAAPAWDDFFAAAATVVYHGGVYRMWYEGNTSIGYATSPDGLVWQKHPGNPVIVPGPTGAWDEEEIDSPTVVVLADTFHMWYSGIDSLYDNRIGHATSPDGINWTKDPANPVIDIGEGGWDQFEAIHPFVLYEDGTFKMWYNGYDGLDQRILYATSSDGTAWMKFNSFFMLEKGDPGRWDDFELGPMTVVRANDGYHMWYMGWDDAVDPEFAIGYATSADGLTWNKATGDNPVLVKGGPGQWDEFGVAVPHVLLIDSVLTMWYGGGDGITFETGVATSQSALVPTLLRSFGAAWTGAGIEIRWSLSETGAGARFTVFRSEVPAREFVPLAPSGLSAGVSRYAYTDRTARAGSSYRYRVDVSDADGGRTLFETDPVTVPVQKLALDRISPNPFNPQLTVEFTVADAGPVKLGVYDTAGRLVRALVNRTLEPGRYEEAWNGRNTSGAAVASGVYFVRLESNGLVRTKKAVLSK